jgi:hypothetical protein
MECLAGRTGYCPEINRGHTQKPGNSLTEVVFPHKTVNSTGSGLIFVQISGFKANPIKYTDPDGRSPKALPYIRAPQIRIEVQRGSGNEAFNDTFTIYNASGDETYRGTVHTEMSMTPTRSNDFTLPEGEYSATLTKTATNYEKSLYITSKTAISPETGKAGISETGHLAHPNEITRESVREKRSASGRSNGPFKIPQSLGCILFKDRAEFDTMWKELEYLGYKDGDSVKLIIRDPLPE